VSNDKLLQSRRKALKCMAYGGARSPSKTYNLTKEDIP
jgi:hypothetical protein